MQVGVMIDVSDPFYVPITPISGPFWAALRPVAIWACPYPGRRGSLVFQVIWKTFVL